MTPTYHTDKEDAVSTIKKGFIIEFDSVGVRHYDEGLAPGATLTDKMDKAKVYDSRAEAFERLALLAKDGTGANSYFYKKHPRVRPVEVREEKKGEPREITFRDHPLKGMRSAMEEALRDHPNATLRWEAVHDKGNEVARAPSDLFRNPASAAKVVHFSHNCPEAILPVLLVPGEEPKRTVTIVEDTPVS